MATKLYFGGLSYNTTEDGLKEACSKYGTVVSSVIIKDRMSGRSKGFGFVEMSTEEEAQKVVAEMNGTEFEGRKITVNEARPMEERPPRRDFGGGGQRRDFRSNDRGGRRSW